MFKSKHRSFQYFEEEFIPCPACETKGRDLRNRMFSSELPPVCFHCGGLGWLDKRTGEQFEAEIFITALLAVRDHYYLQVEQELKPQLALLKSQADNCTCKIKVQPTKEQVYPEEFMRQKRGGFGD